jgi:hypothetical protein
MKSVEGVCFRCWEYSHAYRSADRRVGETAAPVWLCTPIMCALSLFQDVFGCTRDAYEASRLRESLSGSLSMSSMRHVFGIGLLGSFGGDMGVWGRGLCFL